MPQETALRGVRYPITLPSERSAQRRAFDERLFLRFRGLFSLLADRLMRLPPRSRIRRLMLTRFVGRTYAAINRRDFDVLVMGLDPGIEYHPSGTLTPLDFESVFRGHAGYLEPWRSWLETFEDIWVEPEELLDLGDKLLIRIRSSGHGSGSGVPIDATLFQLCRLRDGLVVWQKDFTDRTEALDAAELDPRSLR